MNEKSIALRLAEALDSRREPSPTHYVNQASAELRRLHDDNRRLVNTLNHVSEVRSILVEQRDELLEFVQEVRRTGDTRLASMAIAVISKVTGELK